MFLEEGPQASAFRPCQGALEMVRAYGTAGLSCGQGHLLEEETYTEDL